MRKVKILAIAPYEGLAIQIRNEAEKRDDIELTAFTGDLQEGLKIARKEMNEDIDVILSRGGTALLLAENGYPVIDISISIYDLLRCIRMANVAKKKYAIVGFESITRNAVFIQDVNPVAIGMAIYTIRSSAEAEAVMIRLKKQGIENVVCDQVSSQSAGRNRLNYILINSGSESINAALDEAARLGREKVRYKRIRTFIKLALEASPDIILAMHNGEAVYNSKKLEELSNGFLSAICRKSEEAKEGEDIFLEFDDYSTLYTARGRKEDIQGDSYTIFTIKKTKMPFVLENNGIVLRNSLWAMGQFESSFYGTTSATSHEVELAQSYARRGFPVFIYGERGTGKGNLAQYFYASSPYSAYPLYDIDVQLAGEKTYEFIRKLYEEDPEKKAAFHFKNFDRLDRQAIKELIDMNEELGLARRALLIATVTKADGTSLPSICLDYIERLQCLTLKTKNLRDHREDISSITSLYLASLNRRTGTNTITIDDEGMKLLSSYSWPGNNDQLARVLKKLNAASQNDIILAEEVKQFLKEEEELYQKQEDSFLPSFEGRTLKEIEKLVVKKTLAAENGNKSVTAKKLGLSRATLWRMLQEDCL